MNIKYRTTEIEQKMFPYVYEFKYIGNGVRVLFNRAIVKSVNVNILINYITKVLFPKDRIYSITLENCKCDKLIFPRIENYYRVDISNSVVNVCMIYLGNNYSIDLKGETLIDQIVKPNNQIINFSHARTHIEYHEIFSYMKQNMSNITLNYMNMICL